LSSAHGKSRNRLDFLDANTWKREIHKGTIGALNTIQWIFSGIGVFGLGLLGRLTVFLWRKRAARINSNPASLVSSGPDNAPPATQSVPGFTRPNPDDMTMQVESLPPFQRQTAWDSYAGLEICWQAIFRGIGEDEPANKADPTAKKKWVVDLKHYDPSIDYSSATIYCRGVDLEQYPQFKSLHKNELLIVRGRVDAVKYYWALLYPAQFEFCGKRIR
jgi:hypothetical protein